MKYRSLLGQFSSSGLKPKLWVKSLIFVLVFSFGFSPALTVYADPTDGTTDPIEAKLSNPNLKPVDNFLTSQQGYRKMKQVKASDGKLYDVIESERMFSAIDTSSTSSPILDFNKEVRIRYDAAARELLFERIETDSKTNITRVSEVHFFKNVDLTNTEGNPVYQDPNFLVFATKEGVRGILAKVLPDLIFKASIPAPIVDLDPAIVSTGAKILKIESASPNAQPRRLQDSRGKSVDIAASNDLIYTVQLQDGERVSVHRNYKGDIFTNLSTAMLHLLRELQIVNPNLENFDIVQRVVRENQLDLNAFEARRSAVLSTSSETGSDLQSYALENIGFHLNQQKIAALYDRNGGTKPNAVDAIVSANDYRFSTIPGENSEWARNFKIIEAGRAADQDALKLSPKLQARSWRQILVDELSDPGNGVEKLLRDAKTAQKELTAGILQRSFTATTKYVSAKTMSNLALALTGAVAFDLVDAQTGHSLTSTTFAFISNAYQMSHLHFIPGMSGLAQDFQNGSKYFYQNYAYTSVLAGAVAMLLMRPLSMFAVKTYSDLRGKGWDTVTAFFTYGARMYALGNYPVQKLVWDSLKQRNLYFAIENNIPLSTRGVFNSPRASKESIDANQKHLESFLKSDVVRKQRALVLAAAIISEKRKKENRPIDPATLVMILEADLNSSIEQFSRNLGDAQSQQIWTELTSAIYPALVDLTNPRGQKMNSDEIEEYTQAIQKGLGEFDRLSQSNQKGRAQKWLQNKWKGFADFTSKKAMPFILFGKAGLAEYNKYKNIVIEPRNAQTAEVQYRVDYDASTFYYAAADSRNFGSLARFQIPSIAEIGANQAEQNIIYGVQMGIEAQATNEAAGEFVHSAPPLTNGIFAREGLPKPHPEGSKGFGREESLWATVKSVAGELVNPDSRRSILATQEKRMEVTVTGFQTRLLAGTIPRALGLVAIGLAAGLASGWGGLGLDALSAIPKQTNVLFNKVSLLYTSHFAMGYALIWTLSIFATNVAKDRAEKNLSRLRLADFLTDEGIRLSLPEKMQKGIEAYQELYREGGFKLPAEFAVKASEFDVERTSRFIEYTKQNVPVETVHSYKFVHQINIAGAIISVLLYKAISNDMYDPNVNIWPQLAKTAVFFAGTYVVAKAGQPIAREALRAVQTGYQTSKNFCLGLLGQVGVSRPKRD